MLSSLIFKIKNNISDLFYYLKCHLLKKHKYHLIDIRQPYDQPHFDYYKYGWIDSDHQILFANFKIFCDFVENEFEPNKKYLDFEDHYDEINEIYAYWKLDRPKQIAFLETIRKIKDFKTYHDKMDEFLEKEDEMLIRIIKIRHILWT